MGCAGVWRCGFHRLSLDVPLIMGILNVTPDSFFDGGSYDSPEAVIDAGLAMADAGASVVDVGGESTRPGADAVGVGEEVSRVVPVVRGLAKAGLLVSIDTRNAETAKRSLDAGAQIVNDVSGFRDDAMIEVVADSDCGVVVMHMLGEPKTMQAEPPTYGDVVAEVGEYLTAQAGLLEAAGVDPERIAVDPGIGFGKTVEQNLEIVRRIEELGESGYPVVLGASRKSFIGAVLGLDDPVDRLEGSLAVAVYAAEHGADILRVHDVSETAHALGLLLAITGGFGWTGPEIDDAETLRRAEAAAREHTELPLDSVPEGMPWVAVADGRTEVPGAMNEGVLDLLFIEAMLRHERIPCTFETHRPGEGWQYPGLRDTTRLMVPESHLSRAKRLLSRLDDA